MPTDWAGPKDWIYYVRPVKDSLGRGYWANGSMRWVSSAPTVAHDRCFTAKNGRAPEDSRAYLAYSDRVRTIRGDDGQTLGIGVQLRSMDAPSRAATAAKQRTRSSCGRRSRCALATLPTVTT